MNYQRLTVEEVASLMTRHDFTLIFGPLGLHSHPEDELHRSGCAFAAAVLRHTDDIDEACKLLHDNSQPTTNIRLLSEKINLPYEYVGGLICGYEYPHRLTASTDKDRMAGREDGAALRKFAKEQKNA